MLLRFFYWVGGPVGGPALIVERCLCRRTRRRPERQHPQATGLLIMLNLLSRFNKAWRLTSVRRFIVSPSRKVCSSSELNVEVEWRPKVSIVLYRNINMSQTQHNLNIYICWFDITAEWKWGKNLYRVAFSFRSRSYKFLKEINK